MKRKITRQDGTIEEQEGTPEELRRFDAKPNFPETGKPNDWPDAATKRWLDAIQTIPDRQPCAVEDFLKKNPNQICMLYCSCPKCSPYCLTVGSTSVGILQQNPALSDPYRWSSVSYSA